MSASSDTTILIRRLADGDRAAADALFPAVYEEIHQLATREMSHERVGHTLQATALVHEAFIRMVGSMPECCRDRTQFFGLAARVVRRVLIDHARRRLAAKRGRGKANSAMEHIAFEYTDAGLIELNDALERLAALNARQAKVVELRFFGGLTCEQAADLLGLAVSTVRAEWSCARAWLRRELER